jgi:hypothetical protein
MLHKMHVTFVRDIFLSDKYRITFEIRAQTHVDRVKCVLLPDLNKICTLVISSSWSHFGVWSHFGA